MTVGKKEVNFVEKLDVLLKTAHGASSVTGGAHGYMEEIISVSLSYMNKKCNSKSILNLSRC